MIILDFAHLIWMHFLIVADDTDDPVRMSSSVLASLGVRLDKNLYPNLLAAVKEKRLGRDAVTYQLVSEISNVPSSTDAFTSSSKPDVS